MLTIKSTTFHTINPQSAKALIEFARTIKEFREVDSNSMFFHAGVVDGSPIGQKNVDKLIEFCKQFPDIEVRQLEPRNI